jgi:hypothetical protein
MTTQQTNINYDFLQNNEKYKLLVDINEKLYINKNPCNKLVFIYSAPKVGSTSIVSSLRIFGTDKISVIHIHDEEMLRILGRVTGVTINEIILFNKHLGREVYVIDVYRSPVERKISAFFEKIGAYHFNNKDEIVNKYNVNKVITRFNNIFSHIANGDHFMDKYNIAIPDRFDHVSKYLLVHENGIKYIKLRLKDSNEWSTILTNIFGIKIVSIKDYESSNKPIKDLYKKFKIAYKIPSNLLDELTKCKYLNYYYSDQEKQEYIDQWAKKTAPNTVQYTSEQYNMYEQLSIENSHIDYIQLNHYMDEGCSCKACCMKRAETATKLIMGRTIITEIDRIVHSEAKNELLVKRVEHANKINASIANARHAPQIKGGRKDFNREMSSVVSGRKIEIPNVSTYLNI